jgi:hypothetical protein
MSELEALLDELADAGDVRGAAPVFGAATLQAARRRRTRKRRRVVTVCATIAAVAVVLGAIAQSRRVDQRDAGIRVGGGSGPTRGEGATAAQLAAGHWAIVPAAPVGVRAASVVWTGKEILVWGEAQLPDSSQSPFRTTGAAYDPNTRSWRVLPFAPIGTANGQAAVWTGSEMVIWGGASTSISDAAAYDPARNLWRTLPAAPLKRVGYTIGVWTGDRAVFLAGAIAIAYLPATNRWQRLPRPTAAHPPLSWRLGVAAGSGRVLAWSVSEAMKQTAPNAFEGIGGTDLFRYDESTNRWTALASGTDAISQPEEAIWTGDRLLVRGDMHQPGALGPGPLPEVSAWYDPETGRAQRLSADAMTANHLGAGHFSSAWTGKALLSLNAQGEVGPIQPGDASVYDAASTAWMRLARAPFGCGTPTTPVWTGATLIMYCSDPYPAPSHPVGGLEFVPGPT